jgi:hypothetical protein
MVDLADINLIEEAELNSAVVRAALAYWRGKRRDGRLPDRAELDPIEIPKLLPHLMLKEVRREPWDFRYRLVGTSVREHSYVNWTGKWMSEIPGQGPQSTVFRVVRWVSERGEAAVYRPPYVGPHKEFTYCEAAVMPWTGNGGAVDRVLVAVDFLTT